jgi:hypothetical protein
MFTDQRDIANCILNSEKEIDLCPRQISDGARNLQSAYSVIRCGTILLGSSRRGENKEERYVRRRVFEETGG